jgi:uncharacterized protein YbcI
MSTEESTSTGSRGNGSSAAAISNMMVGLLRDHTGRGPTKARTHISDDLVTCLLQDNLTRGEQVLADNGEADKVLDLRRTHQRLMRDEAVQGVEEILHRRVVSFMSDNTIEPDLAIEVFVLAPKD